MIMFVPIIVPNSGGVTHIKNNVPIEREGKDEDLKLWLPVNKKRFRDVARLHENQGCEGGRTAKDPTTAQLGEIKDYVDSSMPDFREGLLNHQGLGANEPSAKVNSGVADDTPNSASQSQNRQEVIFMAPVAKEKHGNDYVAVCKAVDQARNQCQENLDATMVTAQHQEVDELLASYIMTARVRLNLMRLWGAETLEDAKAAGCN